MAKFAPPKGKRRACPLAARPAYLATITIFTRRPLWPSAMTPLCHPVPPCVLSDYALEAATTGSTRPSISPLTRPPVGGGRGAVFRLLIMQRHRRISRGPQHTALPRRFIAAPPLGCMTTPTWWGAKRD